MVVLPDSEGESWRVRQLHNSKARDMTTGTRMVPQENSSGNVKYKHCKQQKLRENYFDLLVFPCYIHIQK